MPLGMQADTLVLIPLALELTGLTFLVLIDPYIDRGRRRIMLIILVLILSLIVQNYLDYLLLDADGTRAFERTLIAIYGYSVRPVIIALLFYIVGPRRRRRTTWALLGVNAAIHLTALFSGICFSIDAANVFRRGPLGYSCHVVSGLLLVQLLYLTLRGYRRDGKSEAWIPILNTFLIIASVILDSVVDCRRYPVTFLTIAVVNSSLLHYTWLHLQFVREHEQALQAEQRIQIMISQIQPHFLYNTLSTIQALCAEDPAQAIRVTKRFGTYLRQNIESLGQSKLIPFSRELEHTRIYAEIEMERFPGIHVRYDIEDDDFMVPALTLQPLVENAIRHGVRIREDGRVSVSARRFRDGHEIVIRDNGRGFDPAAAPGKGTHIGIQNVRERLAQLCRGTLAIDSVIGEGTTVTIRIPAAPGD